MKTKFNEIIKSVMNKMGVTMDYSLSHDEVIGPHELVNNRFLIKFDRNRIIERLHDLLDHYLMEELSINYPESISQVIISNNIIYLEVNLQDNFIHYNDDGFDLLPSDYDSRLED
jgi:hypothetical protein